ncbi:hypothetical protein PoMZ_12327 [Pyricularia oryzae]|uniref:Uncharacterized protein n=1 Tax=Pyricularia oryzae TaxID=318829 RepID=A0A4V1C821_PYROR|nr:hypothetical protein PoMZ_12327 [Pyricularia oryzae]
MFKACTGHGILYHFFQRPLFHFGSLIYSFGLCYRCQVSVVIASCDTPICHLADGPHRRAFQPTNQPKERQAVLARTSPLASLGQPLELGHHIIKAAFPWK